MRAAYKMFGKYDRDTARRNGEAFDLFTRE
jgi:hypothetical protein